MITIKRIWIIIFLSLIFTACNQAEELVYIPLTSSDLKNDVIVFEESNDAIKVAFSSVVSPEETRYKYNLLVKYLEDHLDRPITIIQKQTYKEVNELLKNGEVDLAFICSLSYVIGTNEGYMEDVATTVIDGKDVYRSYIITHKNSGLESLDDLKGKRFAFADPYSYTGRLAALAMLNDKGYTAKQFFEETFYTYSHDYSISAVARGAVDAAAVDSILFDMLLDLENEDAMQIQIVEIGPWAGAPPIVVSSKTDPELKRKIEKLILTLNDNQRGRNILEELMIEKYIPINRDNYEPIRDALKLMGDD
ncbi:phosphate/phosphite/phosphonate ABC transporter substrate-binding protein [Bacillaceae bacterium IKA-2]|nr:phosphate/phosphite/phosphonate ABC transporter substrate-binding protein [Bacillaceae bacterium IKA-2]